MNKFPPVGNQMSICNRFLKHQRTQSLLKALQLGFVLGVFLTGSLSSGDEPILVPNTNHYPFIGGPGASPFQLSPSMSLGPHIPNSSPLLASGRLSLLGPGAFNHNNCPSTLAEEMNLEGVTSERSTVTHPLPQDCNAGVSIMMKPNSLPGQSGQKISKGEQMVESKRRDMKFGS